MSEKIRVGFVGCGGIAVAHLKGLVINPDVALSAFCDINMDRAKKVAGQYGTKDAKVHNEAARMFEGAELDAAYSCLPPFAHGSELEAIERDIPFFVEKPLNLYLLRTNMESEEIPGEPDIFAVEDKAFTDAVRLNDPSRVLCPYSEGLKTLEVTLAANQSMETGEPVKIAH